MSENFYLETKYSVLGRSISYYSHDKVCKKSHIFSLNCNAIPKG